LKIRKCIGVISALVLLIYGRFVVLQGPMFLLQNL